MKKELNNFNAQPANTDHIDIQEQNKQKLICVLKQKLPMEQTAVKQIRKSFIHFTQPSLRG